MRKLQLEELGRLSPEEYKLHPKIPIVVVLDNLRSGMNVGSFFRTADALRVEKIVLCGITAKPPHKEILKTAIGASESVEWSHNNDVVAACEELKKKGYSLIGIEQTDSSISLGDFIPEPDKKYAIIFGNEVKGINNALLGIIDDAIEIPQYGTKHSFNVAVCGGIVLWHFASPFLGAISK